MSAKTIPGIFKVEYVDANELTLYPRRKLTPGSTTTALGNFNRFPLVGYATLTYYDEKVDAGTQYVTVLSGTLLDTETSNDKVREKLIEKYHAYRATDYYGNRYLVGIDIDPYPEVSFSQVNDNLPSGLRSVDFKIQWISTLPPIELVVLVFFQ